MNIDTLLDEADPGRTLTLHEQTELDRLVDSVGSSRRRPRARAITGIAALSALLLAGGATAAAAAGIWHPSWYDPASDWTTKVKTVDRTFTVDGQPHHCTVTLTLASTYNGKGTPEFQKALSYVRSLDPTKIQPSASQLHDFMNATWGGQGAAPTPPSKAMANQLVWLMDVSQNLFDHLSAIGLDPEKVSFSNSSQICDFAR